MSRLSPFVLPAYLFLCLVLGGSSQGIWGNAILQLLAIAILAWSLLTKDAQPLSGPGRRLLQIAALGVALMLLQLVPLPPALWSALPGREFIVKGFELLGVPLPWMPVSLSPYNTMASALTLLPPIALLAGMLRLRAWSAGWMIAAVIAGAALSIMLGMLQVSGTGESWYFYKRTNLGVAVGAFANGNHFATLLLATIPLVAAIITGKWRSSAKPDQRSLTIALALAAAAMIVIGVLINGSASILLLGPLVAVGTAMMALRLSRGQLGMGIAAIVVLLLLSASAVILFSKDLPGWGTSASIETRTTYWTKSLRVAGDFAGAGSGFGTFPDLYQRYEDPGAVSRWYVNHAHNDYLELYLEGGIPALLLMLGFLLWWSRRAWEGWMLPSGTLEQKAASLASAAILLHSLFDFPLRVAAIAAVFATCLALMAGGRGTARTSAIEERDRPRHATL